MIEKYSVGNEHPDEEYRFLLKIMHFENKESQEITASQAWEVDLKILTKTVICHTDEKAQMDEIMEIIHRRIKS